MLSDEKSYIFFFYSDFLSSQFSQQQLKQIGFVRESTYVLYYQVQFSYYRLILKNGQTYILPI